MHARISLAASLLFLLAPAALAAGPRRAPDATPRLMVLGTYHMGNPGRDVYNPRSDDVRSPKRQRELADLVRRLARFRPTKILVEAPYGDATTADQYARWLAGTFELPSNEREQIAYPLAKATGAKIVPVDVDGEFDFDAFTDAAKKYDQTATVDGLMALGKSFVDELNARIASRTIVEALRWVNAPARVDEGERFYLRGCAVGRGDDYAGAKLVAGWHARNLKIFSNVIREASAPGDRVLVIYGSGHAKLLTEFARDSGLYAVDSPDAYLR